MTSGPAPSLAATAKTKKPNPFYARVVFQTNVSAAESHDDFNLAPARSKYRVVRVGRDLRTRPGLAGRATTCDSNGWKPF